MSSAVTGRLYARRASASTMRSAHALSSGAVSGRQVKMARRLGVSAGVRPAYGPTISTRSTDGSFGYRVNAKLVMGGGGGRPSSGSECSSASTNETPSSRVPAATGTRTSRGARSPRSNRATRSRSSRISRACPARDRPRSATRMTYSASRGKWWRTASPPRDPNGRSSLTRPSWASSGDVR